MENDDYNNISTKWYIDNGWRNDNASIYYSVSAWVWSDKEISTVLMLKSNTENAGVSAFHSGGKKWEYMTVIYPYADNPESFELSLLNKYGTTVIKDITAVALRDNRFKEATGAFSEHLFTKKISSRKRILFVGGSTVKGHCSEPNTLPFIMQLKLESIYPGKYEVVNYGIDMYHLEGHLISYNTDPVLKDSLHSILPVNYIFQPLISSLKPDYVFVALSDWGSESCQLSFSCKSTAVQLELFCLNSCEVFGENNCNAVIDALLEYKTYPSEDNYKILKQIYLTAQQCSTTRMEKMKSYDFDTIGDVNIFNPINKNTNDFLEAYSGGNTYFRHLFNKFVSLIRNSSKIHGFTIPVDLVSLYTHEPQGYFMRLYGSQMYDGLCRELNNTGSLNCLDIDSLFQAKYSTLNYGDYLKAGIFCDGYHSTYRGLEFIADELFSYFKDEI
ncbi:MAG: hypothetical protein HQK99_17520 [Nitrospirae bacterium]|nr:hypothetical protein [Nitrospirota bacterium]